MELMLTPEEMAETPEVTSHASIADSTVILKVNFGLFGNIKKVPTSIIAGAEQTKLLKVQKTLLESPELKAISSADTGLKSFLKSKSLPYEEGFTILPLGKDGEHLKTVHARIIEFTKERDTLVDAFILAYPNLIEDAKIKTAELATNLGVTFEELWNPSDYPPAEQAREEFTFTWSYHSFAVPDTLKMAGLYEAAKVNAETKMQAAAEGITLLMRQTLLDLVAHLKAALEPSEDGKKKKLHKSAVTNIQTFLEDFKTKNITNDKELDGLVLHISSLLHPGFDVDVLKKDEAFKDEVHSKLGIYTDKLNLLVEKVPGRKFKDVE